MNRRSSPAFLLYADDFFSGVADLDDDEVGVYIRLLCLAWSKGPLAWKACRAASRDDDLIKEVLAMKFQVDDQGKWVNERLEQVRQIQQERSRAGRKGGSKTQAKVQAKLKQTPKQNGKQNSSKGASKTASKTQASISISSSISNTSSKTKDPPVVPQGTDGGLQVAIAAWSNHKKGKLTQPMLSRILNVAAEYSPAVVCEAIDRAIGNGWKGWEHDLDGIRDRLRHRAAEDTRSKDSWEARARQQAAADEKFQAERAALRPNLKSVPDNGST